MNSKLEILKSISEKGLLVVASSEKEDVSWKDYLLLLSDGYWWVYNLRFKTDQVKEIIIDDVEVRIYIN